jgi:molybdopterin/thiamine biosynthesis adenylyltransferase
MVTDVFRYHRQMLLPGFGEAGQARLTASTAFIAGCGALGSVAADLLARAGVGTLIIADRDIVDLTNLQRQVLFDEQDVADGLPKAEAARRRLVGVNSEIEITAVVDDINYATIERHASGADILIDGLDNFETRYLLNDFAVKHGKPYMYGGAVGTTGAALAILPHTADADAPWEIHDGGSAASPCLRCLFEEAPPPGASPTCDTVGVLASVVSTIASFEVGEALKVLTGNYDRVCRTMLNVDAWENSIYQLNVDSAYEHGDCPCCKHRTFEYLDGARGSGATSLCGRDAVQLTHKQRHADINLDAVGARLREHGEVTVNPYMVRAQITDNGKPYTLSVFPDGRAIVHGTGEANIARGVYAKYVGT